MRRDIVFSSSWSEFFWLLPGVRVFDLFVGLGESKRPTPAWPWVGLDVRFSTLGSRFVHPLTAWGRSNSSSNHSSGDRLSN